MKLGVCLLSTVYCLLLDGFRLGDNFDISLPNKDGFDELPNDALDLNEYGKINEVIKIHSLVGKVLPNINTKHLTIFAIMKKAWKCGDDLGKNLFIFSLFYIFICFVPKNFWVHVHSITMTLNKEIASKIGSLFSVFFDSNLNENVRVKWDRQLNIKIALRVEDPLKLGFTLNQKCFKPLIFFLSMKEYLSSAMNMKGWVTQRKNVGSVMLSTRSRQF
ncbi:hypothetical protein GQ457_05G015710 [Hibiscus cannabinus]